MTLRFVHSVPRYEWLRNGEHLDLDRFMSLDGGNLVITGHQSRHEGYYQCKAKNKYGMALSQVTSLQRAGKLMSLGHNSMSRVTYISVS